MLLVRVCVGCVLGNTVGKAEGCLLGIFPGLVEVCVPSDAVGETEG